MDRFSIEVKVGIVVTVAVGLVLAFIFILGEWNPFSNTFRITVTLNYAGGIKPGSDVHVAGAKVGKVDSIRFLAAASPSDQGPVLGLELLIDKRAKELIREDSVFSVHMESLLGGKIVEIIPGTAASPVLEDGAVVRGQDPPQLEDLINEGVALLGEITAFMDDLTEEDKERLRALLSTAASFGPEDARNVKTALANAAQASEDLKVIAAEVRPDIGPLVKDLAKTLEQAQPLAADARKLVKEARSAVAELRALMPDEEAAAGEKIEELMKAAEDLALVADRLERFTAMIETEYGDLDRAEIERIIRQFLQQEGITVNVGTVVKKPSYPSPPPGQ